VHTRFDLSLPVPSLVAVLKAFDPNILELTNCNIGEIGVEHAYPPLSRDDETVFFNVTGDSKQGSNVIVGSDSFGNNAKRRKLPKNGEDAAQENGDDVKLSSKHDFNSSDEMEINSTDKLSVDKVRTSGESFSLHSRKDLGEDFRTIDASAPFGLVCAWAAEGMKRMMFTGIDSSRLFQDICHSLAKNNMRGDLVQDVATRLCFEGNDIFGGHYLVFALHFNTLSTASLEVIASAMSMVAHPISLDLHRNSLETIPTKASTMKTMQKLLSKPERLRMFCQDAFRSLRLVISPSLDLLEFNLMSLQLNSCSLTEEDVPLILEIVSRSPKIHVLNLSDNQLGTKGFHMLCEGLRTNPTITHLDVSNNAISGDEVSGTLVMLFESNEHLSRLTMKSNHDIMPYFDRKIMYAMAARGPDKDIDLHESCSTSLLSDIFKAASETNHDMAVHVIANHRKLELFLDLTGASEAVSAEITVRARDYSAGQWLPRMLKEHDCAVSELFFAPTSWRHPCWENVWVALATENRSVERITLGEMDDEYGDHELDGGDYNPLESICQAFPRLRILELAVTEEWATWLVSSSRHMLQLADAIEKNESLLHFSCNPFNGAPLRVDIEQRIVHQLHCNALRVHRNRLALLDVVNTVDSELVEMLRTVEPAETENDTEAQALVRIDFNYETLQRMSISQDLFSRHRHDI
jgi:hypothetical protein